MSLCPSVGAIFATPIQPHFFSTRMGGRGRGRGGRSAGSWIAGGLGCSGTVSTGFEALGSSCSFGRSFSSIGTVSTGFEALGSSCSFGRSFSGIGVDGALRAAQPTIERTTIMTPTADNQAAVRLSLSLLRIAGIIKDTAVICWPMCVENSLNSKGRRTSSLAPKCPRSRPPRSRPPTVTALHAAPQGALNTGFDFR